MASRLLALAILIFGTLALSAVPAIAERRVALVIGNGAYAAVPRLPNSVGDATAMAAALRGLGFAVHQGLDLDKRGMEELLGTFAEESAGADLAVLFYAGHGIQVDGENWLLPVDARLAHVSRLPLEAVPVGTVTGVMAAARSRVVILDACRDNPFAGTMAVAGTTRSVSRGLARVERADLGTLVAYATAPGMVADDGEGRHSPFTAALLEHLASPVEVREMLTAVRRQVVDATGGRQVPWESASLLVPVYLAARPAAPTAVPALPAPDSGATDLPALPLPPAGPGGYSEQIVLTMWNAAVSSNSPALYQAFVDQFPEHPLAVAARIKIDELQPRDLAAIVPPPPAPPPPPPPATPRSDGPAVEEMSGRYVVTTNANVRTGPSTGHPRVDTLPGGTELAVTGKAVGTNWYRVGLSDGRTAFISGTLVQESGTYQGARQAVARLAPPPPRRLHEPQQQYTEDSPLEVVQAAAEAGNADAQVELGLRHAMGEGDGEQSYAEAVRWFREAAERNRVVAQYNLGVLYERGLGVAASPPEAVRWYRLAAAQGHPGAQYNLGVAFAEGRGVEQDYAAAAVLFRDAADAGLPRAMFNLGLTYEYGLGVQASENEAASWYQQAAAAGDTSAAERMAQITARREAAAAPDQTLSQSEIGGVVEQIARCWNVPSGARGASDLKIEIAVEINADGTVRDARIVDTARYGSDDVFRAVAESARRAVLNPQCSPLRLPPDKYEAWKRTTLVFDPSRML